MDNNVLLSSVLTYCRNIWIAILHTWLNVKLVRQMLPNLFLGGVDIITVSVLSSGYKIILKIHLAGLLNSAIDFSSTTVEYSLWQEYVKVLVINRLINSCKCLVLGL